MFDKLLDHSGTIMAAVAVVLLALVCYSLGSESRRNKFCSQVGGVYVQTWNGHKCIMATEIDL